MQTLLQQLNINKETLPVISQMAECMPGGFYIYAADKKEELIYFNSRLRDMFLCKTDEQFRELVNNSFCGMVHPDDLEACEKEIAVQTVSCTGMISRIMYRIRRLDGSIGKLHENRYRTHNDAYGDIYCVFVNDVSEEDETGNLRTVVSVLAEDYEMLFHMDFKSGEVEYFTTGPWVDKNDIAHFTALSYEEKIYYFADKYIVAEDRSYYLQSVQMENVLEMVDNGKPIVVRFRMQLHNQTQWYEMKAVHQPEHVGQCCAIVGIRNVNSEMEYQENLSRIATRDRQHLLAFHDIINSGMWNIILDEETNILQVKWSDEYRHLLGYTDENDFPDVLESWYEKLHPDDREAALDAFWRGAHSRNRESAFDTDFRLLNKNGQYYWYHAAGRIEPNEDGTYLYFGIFVDNTAQHENEQYQAMQKQNLEIIEILASEYSSVYYIDLTTDGLKPYSMNAETESEFGQIFNSGISYSEAFRLYVDRLILDEDKEMMLKEGSVENIRKRLLNQKTFITSYRSSDNRYNEMKFVKVGKDNEAPVAVALGFADRDEEIRGRMQVEQERQRNFDIIEILASEYSSVYYIDLMTDELNPYTMNAETETTFGSVFRSGITYSEAYRLYVGKQISLEDQSMMLQAGSVSNIRKELENKKSFITTYRDAGNRYSEMKFVKVGNDDGLPTAVALGFADRDEEIRRRMQVEQERQRNFDIIEILASEYSSVYYIDLTTDELNPYTMNADTENAFGQIFRKGIHYSDAYRMYVDQMILSEDKAMMLKAGSLGNIMKELRTKKTFITTYRNSEGHYSEMKFVKVGNDDGLPTAVALGFADKDDEIRAREEEQQKLQRNIDIIEILASEYTSVYYIDLTTDELDPYTMNADTENAFGQIFRSGIHYSDAFRMYVNTLVNENDREMMLKAGSIYNILKEMSTKKSFITTYMNEEGHYSEMKFVKVGDEENPQAVALGFADKDKEIRSELERKETADRDAAVISGLSDDFGCVVYTSYDDFSEIHYRFDPLFEEHIDGWSKINNFAERLEALVNTIMHPDDRAAFWKATRPQVVHEAVDRDNVYYVNFRTLVDGEVTYYQCKFVKDDQHKDTHVIAGFHNVDAETKREMEALNKANSASRAKTDFLFNMSHDIRTPMNAIIGFTNMAIKDIDNREKAIESLEKVRISSDMLLSLINDILDMSRIESGKVTLNEEKYDMDCVYTKIEPVMTDLARRKDIDIRFEIGDIQDRYNYVDVARVERVMVNLISNAIKYTPADGTVRVLLEQDGRLDDNTGRYRFVVSDNGIGMSEEFQKHMFEEFSREETSTISGIQGTGLGLALAQKLVQLMNGEITCKSKQGVGSTFTVVLPFRLQTQEEQQQMIEKQVEKTDTISLSGKRALLVDDNDLNREIALCILEDEGMTVETAVNGNEALSTVIEHGNEYYDFILMDIQMPVMDGYQATKEIRKAMPDLKTPIIALSANAFEEDRKKSLESGMDDHIAKPINIEELLNALHRFQ